MKPTRDARPFLAQHLRRCADEPGAPNAEDLHALARWIENLPARHPQMAIIEHTDALGFDDGSFRGGDEAQALIVSYIVDEDADGREAWLVRFAAAVARYWA